MDLYCPLTTDAYFSKIKFNKPNAFVLDFVFYMSTHGIRSKEKVLLLLFFKYLSGPILIVLFC